MSTQTQHENGAVGGERLLVTDTRTGRRVGTLARYGATRTDGRTTDQQPGGAVSTDTSEPVRDRAASGSRNPLFEAHRFLRRGRVNEEKYLPVMLEFAAAAPLGRGELVLREHRASLELLRAALRDCGTAYAEVLEAICLTVGEPSAADRVSTIKVTVSGPPVEMVGLEPIAPPRVVPTSGASR